MVPNKVRNFRFLPKYYFGLSAGPVSYGMKYHLYFHDDFDGMASGAVMLNFLRLRGDDIASYSPIDYTPRLNDNWVRYKFKKPFILVDFRYHPEADWWFDHHKSSFSKPALAEWHKMYKMNATHNSNSAYPSCASLILANLRKYFKYNPPWHIKELIRWDDIIDSVRYKTLKDCIESRAPALKIHTYINYEKNKNRRIDLIKNMASRSMKEIASGAHVIQKVRLGLTENIKTSKKLKKISQISKKVVYVDGASHGLNTNHLVVYYVFPFVKYSVVLEKMLGGYHLGIGFNQWQKEKQHVDVSKVMEKYGGGGHATVGAVELKSKKEIMKITQEIIEYLNKHG